MENMGQQLRELREDRGLMQTVVAKRIGISNKVLSNFENDVRLPDLHTFKLLCEFYNVSADLLLEINTKHRSHIPVITDDERRILAYYQKLNDLNKDIARGYLANLCKDQQINARSK
ncbi:MAG: helix-turn-helix transcriptional regulator [Lachnospiraceae bacterium]|jgi:transcriptional regulator with XRE-family HTH domain|nr:helix-turn-helix transcriptional regulator [Lachnospiraceae bacterium]